MERRNDERRMSPHLSPTDPRVSAWVSANAGAGKTYLLTDRVTRLLLSGAKPSRILCLTYTKAAAAEMQTRLFARLGEWALLPDRQLTERLLAIGAETPSAEDLRRARRLFAQALEEPGGLKIQTIHAFCQHVLARFPVEAGIPARFTVMDERGSDELMAQARNAVLERAGKGDPALAKAVAVLATRAADGRFAEILNFAIGDSGRLRALLGAHGGDQAQFFAHVRRVLAVSPEEDEAQLIARFCEELGGERETCERMTARLLQGSASEKKFADQLASFFASGMAPERFDRFRKLFFTEQNEPRKSLITKARAASDPDLASYLDRLQARVLAFEDRRKAVSN